MRDRDDNAAVCCIGGMTLDRVLRLRGPGSLGTTNAVESRRAHGGAARNVAECLARHAVPTRLLSIVGDDQDGRTLVLETARLGVDTGLVQKSLSQPTGSLITVQRQDGKLFAAFADMDVCSSMDRAFIQNRWIQISQAPFVFADACLPADSLAWLILGCREHKLPLLVDAVSTAAASRLPLNMHGVKLLFCSADEARSILGDDLEKDAIAMAEALRRRGAERVLVAAEDRLGCAVPHSGFALDIEPCIPWQATQRASLIGGIVYGSLRRRGWRAALSFGLDLVRDVPSGPAHMKLGTD